MGIGRKVTLALLIGASTISPVYAVSPDAQEQCKRYIQLSDACARSKDWEGLGTNARKAFEFDSENWEAALNLSTYFVKVKRFSEARKYAETALRNVSGTKETAVVYANLSGIEYNLRNFQKAKEYVNTGLSIDPNNGLLSLLRARLGSD